MSSSPSAFGEKAIGFTLRSLIAGPKVRPQAAAAISTNTPARNSRTATTNRLGVKNDIPPLVARSIIPVSLAEWPTAVKLDRFGLTTAWVSDIMELIPYHDYGNAMARQSAWFGCMMCVSGVRFSFRGGQRSPRREELQILWIINYAV